MSVPQGTSPNGVVVVCGGGSADPFLEDLIHSGGYDVERASSLAEVSPGFRTQPGSTAVLLNTDGEARVQEVCAEAEERFPGVRLLALVPDATAGPEGLEPGDEGSGGVLWVSGRSDSPENADRIRRFLQGEGYRWISDLEQNARLGASLVGGMARRSNGRHEREARKLLQFASDLSKCTDLQTMLREALLKYLEILDCGAGSMYLWDQGTETLTLCAAEGPDLDARLGLRQRLGEGLAGWVAEAREPMLVTDTRKVHRLSGRDFRRYPAVSCIATPITHNGQLFGVVCVTMPKDNEALDAEDLQLAQALSQKLGALLPPMALLSELRQFNDRLLEVFKSRSHLVAEKDTQMEAMRVLSSDILDGIPLGVIAYDRRLRVCFANTTAGELFHLDADRPASQVGLPLVDAIDVDRTAWRAKLLATVEREAGFRLERVAQTGTEPPRVLDIRGSPLHDSDGASLGGIITVQDVSEDVEMEAKLFSAERLALIGTIAAKVAHELNNPLDGIHRFLSLALRQLEDNPQKARSCLEEVRQGLLRMGNIVGQLLAFSRRHRTAGRDASLSQVLRDVVVLYEERATANNVAFHTSVAPDLPVCKGVEMFEVFSNVIKNALDAMADGGVVTIESIRQPQAVLFVISDTGPGVPEEIRDKIFEPFFTTKRNGTGTGLGLAGCRDAMSRIGGSIHLCPSERGARFEILVPIAERAEGQGGEDRDG